MSEVNAEDHRIINAPEDIIETYWGTEFLKTPSKIGVEVELAFFDPQTPDLAPMNAAQNRKISEGSDFIRHEPTAETLEICSLAADQDHLRTILDDTNAKIALLTKKAASLDLKRSLFQHLPDKTARALLQNIMDIPRYQAFFGPPRADMVDVAAYFAVCKSNQVSVSYKNPDHMLDNIRRLYTLAPFLFMITDNNPPFNEGQAFKGHAGMYHRTSLGARGGVPPYVFTARGGHEYIRSHIDHVMHNPLFVHYDAQGKLVRLPSGTWTSFAELTERGLNTATNYYFSESILWPDVKIAALKNDHGKVVSHRYEARMFGVGAHQHQSALLIVAALAFDPAFGGEVDALLRRFGFDLANPRSLEIPLRVAYRAAQNHNGNFLNISYGKGSLARFAESFADLLQSCAFLKGFQEELRPLLSLCRSGYTDSKVSALLCRTLQDAQDLQRAYDPEIFENPNKCAAQIFEKELTPAAPSLPPALGSAV